MISPPLVTFVTKTHAGYCQYFAGAMALMLRYLGIPARVAVGFAGGSYDPNQHLWDVTDREAHAWVEVWFKGYGWLPFDPTPAGPGAPARTYQAVAGATVGQGAGGPTSSKVGPAGRSSRGSSTVAQKISTQNGFFRTHGGHGQSGSPSNLGSGSGGVNRSRPVLLLLVVLVAAIGGIVLTKAAVRMTRRVRRDPRAVAAACR